jgi:DNA-binding response OmpR family regulator
MSRALIISPDETSRYSARLALEVLDFEVSLASDGGEALSILLRSQPDLVLLDGETEQGDPFGLITTITALSPATRPYLIFTTSRQAAVTVNEALEAGADDYLIGPCGAELLGFKLAQARSRGLLRGNAQVTSYLRKVV